MATGTAVATGDLITAAKMNLKQETGVDLANLSINDTGADHQLAIVVNENLSADRTLNIIVNDAARTINIAGDITLAGALVTSGAFSLTFTITAGTNVTLPTTGTLATLAGAENLSGKTITAAALSGTFTGTPTFSGTTITFTGTRIALTGGAAFDIGTTDAFALILRAGGGNRLGISNTIGNFTIYQTTANYTLTANDPAASRTLTIADPLGNDTFVFLAATQSLSGKTISMSGNLTFASALDIEMAAATAVALELWSGVAGTGTAILAFDTRATTDNVVGLTVRVVAPTIAGVGGTTFNKASFAAYTFTTSTTTTITALNGLQLSLGAPTIAQSGGAVTATTVSTLFVGTPVAGASVTLTNNYIINTGTAGCFVTAAGTWTNTSLRASKRDIAPIDFDQVLRDIQLVDVVTFTKKDASDGGWQRYGCIADDVPDFLAMPGRQGIGSIYMAGFALAGVKLLQHEHDDLAAEVADLRERLAKAERQLASL